MAEIPVSEHSTVKAIYDAYEERGSTVRRERSYLGASVLGHECDRHLWYAFRWAAPPEQFSGRMLRLFETGLREEDRVIEDLIRAGFTVSDQQLEVMDETGHLLGHIDGVVLGIPEAPKTQHLLEVKSHNDKSFKALLKNGVQKSKPAHYTQMQIYMHYTHVDRALYIAVNKNDDALYSERVPYDQTFAEQQVKRAERIIKAEIAPPKIAEDVTDFRYAMVCNYCHAKGTCQEGEGARRNCRTCISSTPVDDGGWHCAHWGKILTTDEQRVGCDAHLLLPTLVHGEQVDADEAARTITYRLPSGEEWVDGVRTA